LEAGGEDNLVFLEIMELVFLSGTFSGTKALMPQKVVFMMLLT